MGILNLTDDSFHAESRLDGVDACLEQAGRMIAEGADILDIGAESTRPGAARVDAKTQIERLLPVIERIRSCHPQIPISVDTTRASVAEAVLDLGANMINDISGLADDAEMVATVARHGVAIVINHLRETPETMQQSPHYEDVTGEVRRYFLERVERALDAGIRRNAIVLDPGIGFGKNLQHNLELLRNLDTLKELGFPLLVGASRKSFIGELLDLPNPSDRLEGTLAVTAYCAFKHVDMVRVHDVRANRQVVDIAGALM